MSNIRMMNRIRGLCCVCLLFGCQTSGAPQRNVPAVSLNVAPPPSAQPSIDSRALPRASTMTAYGIEGSVRDLMTSVGHNPNRLFGADREGRDVPLPGVTVEVPADQARDIVRSLRRSLPPGYFVFVNRENWGEDGAPDRIGVMKANDMFEVIVAIGTNGWYHDVGPRD